MAGGAGGGMFSWSESLSLLGVGLSGCGKQILAMLVDPSSQIQRNPEMCSWMAASCSCMCTELEVASGVTECGGMGSGVIFSSTVVAWSVE